MIGKTTRTALLVVAANFVVSSAEADPAAVFRFDTGGCGIGWINFASELITLPGEMGIAVDTNNGKDTVNLICHGQIPDDGSVPPVDAVLPLYGFNGAGVFTTENTMGAECLVGGVFTTDFQEVVSPSGLVHLVCKVHP